MANHDLIRFRRLFEGADAGLYTLPGEITAARRAVEVLKSATFPTGHGNEQEIADRLVTAAADGELPADWPAAIRSSHAESERANSASITLKIAKETADDRLLAVTLDLAETILTEHLRPKLDEAIAIVRPHADAAIDLPWGVPTRLFKPQYAAILDALGLGGEIYSKVRLGQAVIRDVTGRPDETAHSFFGELRSGMRARWPTYRTQLQTPPPWGDLEGPARFAWLVANLADDIWMPTAEECDAAYRDLIRSGGLKQAGIPA